MRHITSASVSNHLETFQKELEESLAAPGPFHETGHSDSNDDSVDKYSTTGYAASDSNQSPGDVSGGGSSRTELSTTKVIDEVVEETLAFLADSSCDEKGIETDPHDVGPNRAKLVVETMMEGLNAQVSEICDRYCESWRS